MDGLLAGLDGGRVRVRSPRAADLRSALDGRATVTAHGADEPRGQGLPASEVGDLAHANGIPLHLLSEVEQSLEDAYLSLTEDSVEHHGHVPGDVAATVGEGAAR